VNELDVYPLLVEVMETPVVIVVDDHIERVCEVGWKFCKYASD
jgi:endonuclease III